MVTRHLLWSGGWDSTFRLLYTLLVRGEAVQPHYIINIRRPTLHREIQAQVRIRKLLQKEHPKAASRLYPVRYSERFSLPVDPTLHRQYYSIKKIHPTGP